jgi:hypothetical protein
MLKFSEANAKTERLLEVPELQQYLQGKRKVYSLDLLSGWSCPAAQDCLAKVYVDNGKRRLEDGPLTKFRCFSASQEVAYPNVYNARKHNFDAIKEANFVYDIRDLILESLPKNAGIVRYHVAGDFFCISYLKAAISVAVKRPDVLFYGYTKMINLLSRVYMDNPAIGKIRDNFLITASYGGKYDHLIKMGIRSARVIFDESEANGLPIDHDDSHAATIGGDFTLLLHGIQPKGSPAAVAWKALKGKGSYSR